MITAMEEKVDATEGGGVRDVANENLDSRRRVTFGDDHPGLILTRG